MLESLTTLERRILDYLVEYLRENTYQPSVREIGRRFDIKSTKTVSELLQSLADKGWVERDPSRSRGVRLLGIDLSGQTQALGIFEDAAPAEAQLPRDVGPETILLDRRLAGGADAFALVMKGESMAGAGILDGDLLVVVPVPEEAVEDGDVVVARLGEVGVVRTFTRQGAQCLLEVASAGEAPLLLRAADFVLVGRVTAVVRRLRPAAAPLPAGEVAEAGDAL